MSIGKTIRCGRLLRHSYKWVTSLGLILGAIAFSSSAMAAGVDSRTLTCADLQSLIIANHFVFINNPTFEDFVVANAYYCGGGEPVVQLRSVPTSDRPECLVNYCVPNRSFGM